MNDAPFVRFCLNVTASGAMFFVCFVLFCCFSCFNADFRGRDGGFMVGCDALEVTPHVGGIGNVLTRQGAEPYKAGQVASALTQVIAVG